MSCSVCNCKAGIYKCSACFSKYCSSACCKNHKNVCNPPVIEEKPTKKVELSVDEIPSEKLELLRHNKQLEFLLVNPHLREMLHAIDNSTNSDEAMQKAMLEPIFREFATTCLNTVEPDTKIDTIQTLDL